MENKKLFRKKALEARHEGRILQGEVLLLLPQSYRGILVVVALILVLAVGLLVGGSYTTRVTVKGEVFSTLGAIPVYLPKPGVIKHYYVNEDEQVLQDAPLFRVSTETYDSENRATSAGTVALLRTRKHLLQQQLENERTANEQQINALHVQLGFKRNERKLVAQQLVAVKRKNDLLAVGLKKYEAAHLKDAISDDAMTEKTLNALNGKIDYHERQRQLEALDREVDDLTAGGEQARSEYNRRTLELKRELLTIDEQILTAESQQGSVVNSPATGIVTAVQGFDGSYYETQKPVCFILPLNAAMEARLIVPAQAIGFLKKGDRVALRYSAYPHQQFGQGDAVIYSISGTALLPTELSYGALSTVTEPMYLVKARIATQTVTGNGATYALKPGLALEADILLETHRVYQWLIRPFLSLPKNL